MRVIEHTFSDLLRRPNEVTNDLPYSDLIVRRRDGADIHITLKTRHDTRDLAFDALTQLLRQLISREPESAVDAAADAFPWSSFLPPEGRTQFLQEFTRTMAGAAALDNYAPVVQLLTEWRATAEVYADPDLLAQLSSPIDEPEGSPVLPPPE